MQAYLPKSLLRSDLFSHSSLDIRMISRIPRTHIMINPYLYPWCILINSVIFPQKFTISIRRRNMVTIRDRPFAPAHSAKAE